ncbi:unnamed protein product [Sphagnum jensenii]|uniref:Uncharacterized protein n=1 Tax=Sphagnum jensenii TaxID=128206 RepID=A0ABP1AJL9_9BRYO
MRTDKHTSLALRQWSPASDGCGGSPTVPTRKVALVPSPLRQPFSSSHGLSIVLQPIKFDFAAAELLSGTYVQVGPTQRPPSKAGIGCRTAVSWLSGRFPVDVRRPCANVGEEYQTHNGDRRVEAREHDSGWRR